MFGYRQAELSEEKFFAGHIVPLDDLWLRTCDGSGRADTKNFLNPLRAFVTPDLIVPNEML